MTPGRWMMAAILAGMLASPATEALAGKGDKISATVNGHHVRLRRGQVCDGANVGGVSMVGSQKPRHLGQVVRGLAVACAGDFASSLTPLGCSVAYTEIKIAKAPTYKQFVASTPDVTVTFMSFDGTRTEGTFSGTLQPLSGATTPVTVTNGRFSLVLGGDACTSPADAE